MDNRSINGSGFRKWSLQRENTINSMYKSVFQWTCCPCCRLSLSRLLICPWNGYMQNMPDRFHVKVFHRTFCPLIVDLNLAPRCQGQILADDTCLTWLSEANKYRKHVKSEYRTRNLLNYRLLSKTRNI